MGQAFYGMYLVMKRTVGGCYDMCFLFCFCRLSLVSITRNNRQRQVLLLSVGGPLYFHQARQDHGRFEDDVFLFLVMYKRVCRLERMCVCLIHPTRLTDWLASVSF